MDALFLFTALALPILLGGALVNLVVPQQAVARFALVWGPGTIIGLLLLPQLMRMLDGRGFGLNFQVTAITICALSALAVVLRTMLPRAAGASAPPSPTLGWPARLLYLFLLALIALRLFNLGLEIYWRPLFPWDATMHWATKARVWFEYETIAPFVHHSAWRESLGEGVFVDRHSYYPPAIPLLQVWMNLSIGRWDESLMNLPWLACLAGLGLALYGQMRLAGAGPVVAMVFTYFLVSVPLVNTHVALAGYADLFLGAAYCCALMAFHNWTRTRQAWLLVMSLVFAATCPLLKNEGIIWAMTLAPALAWAMLPRAQAIRFMIFLGLLGILFILLVPDNMVIAGTTLAQLQPTFNPEGLNGTIKSLWLHDNWHLLGYMLLLTGPVLIRLRGVAIRYEGALLALGSAFGAFIFLFLFTGFAAGASDLAAVGRLAMHLMPALLFLLGLLYNELLERRRTPTLAY